jgi:hypothetical protein
MHEALGALDGGEHARERVAPALEQLDRIASAEADPPAPERPADVAGPWRQSMPPEDAAEGRRLNGALARFV